MMAEKTNKKSKLIKSDEINVQPENKVDNNNFNDNQTTPNKKRAKLKKGISGFNELRIKKSGFMLTVFKYFKKYPILYIVAMIATVASAAVSVIIPKITNNFLAVPDGFSNWNNILNLAYILISLQIGSGLFMYVRNLTGSMIGVKVEIEYRNKVLKHLLELDMSYYEDRKIGDTLTKLISDTGVIGENMQSIPLTILSSVVTFFGSIYVIFSLNWQLSLIVLGIVLLILVVSILNVQIIRYLNYKWRKVYTDVNADITDRLSTITLIKSNATEKTENERFVNEHLKYYQAAKKTITFDSFTRALLITLLTGINIVGLVAGFIFVNKGMLQPTTLIAFILAVNTLIFPVIQSIVLLGNLAKTSTSIIRVNEILDVEPKIKTKDNALAVNEITNDIVFENVNFRYDDKEAWILENFNFTFEKGKSYAIVGATGVGKTTISKLLLRYYDPAQGRILINKDTDLRDVDLTQYLHHIGYIEQDPQILYGTFAENISYTKQGATLDEIKAAAAKANLHDYVQELPNGYNTILGERGINLSGGQKQRVAIARIFLKNPELLILDEATSALDNIVEKEIQTQFNKLMIGRTSIVIAHRLSTIKTVDKILVLEKGKGLVQIGTFDELKVKEGHFKHLYEAGIMG
ncbi:ABC transporter ATP-binding protein [Spiroplasma endosymbiont of Nebria brevicollis]|uniref:ABC transporter ATP-binding protein n=1 Tax=Spiroplasma endosymbiont of Nebria brevicollis TaxID=3066284 RepID=UPI00313D567D